MLIPLRVLIVEDSIDDVDLILRELRRMGRDPVARRVETATEMRAALKEESWDAVLSDYRLPQFSAPAALAVLRESGHDLPFIVVSGSIGEDSAVGVLKDGAHDFITKGMLARLTTAIDREVREAANRRTHRAIQIEGQQAAQRIRTLVAVSPIGHVLFDRQGVVSVWNPAAERLFGCPAAEAVGQRFPLFDIEFNALFTDMCDRAWSGTPFTAVEASVTTKDRRVVLVSISLVPLMAADGSAPVGKAPVGKAPDGTAEGAVGLEHGDLLALFEDITERKGLERQLFQSQKMDAIGKLAGGVAHDFNNLLTVINGRSHRMLGKLQPEDPLWREADIIYQTGERAARLVRQLLAFSRKQVARPQAMDINSVISDLAKVLKSLLGEGVELATVLEPGLKSIKADPAQLEQVVINLVVNASEAMAEGGRLTIQTSNARIDEGQARTQLGAVAGNYVCLSVTDTGIGMDEATQTRIFEPFFTTKNQGSGLGLAMIYGIVKHAGGFISVISAPGRGSTIRIHLPVSHDSRVDLVLQPSHASLHGSEQILVVEDEDDVRSLVVQILEVHGYQVKSARNWVEAFGIAKRLEGRINLLLTDVVMPQMSGREIAASLTPLCPGLKVLYMSGYTDSAIVQHGVLESGLNFLQKPFSPDVLLRAVRQVFDTV